MYEEEDGILEELEEAKHKKSLSKALNKKKMSSFEVDEFFIEA